MRYGDFLKTAVLLFAGAASALAVVAIAGANASADVTLLSVAVVWWALAALIGLWLGRGASTAPGVARLLADARSASALPEVEPGRAVVNRLWPLATVTLLAGALGFLLPQVPAVATGYALIAALAWRKQARAVAAIEDRDGVRFYLERTSPLRPMRLVRTPGFRKLEVAELPARGRNAARAASARAPH